MKSIILNLMMFITFYWDNYKRKTHKEIIIYKDTPSKYFCIEKKSIKFNYDFYSSVESVPKVTCCSC